MQVRDRLSVSKLVTKLHALILNLCKVKDVKGKSVRLHAFKVYVRERERERERERDKEKGRTAVCILNLCSITTQTLYPTAKQPSVPIALETGLTPAPVRTLGGKTKNLLSGV